MGLKKYHVKRKFNQTTEPRGVEKKSGSTSIFVVQKHSASHLHYDFRLDVEGILKSWAVPKGIPKPGEKRLAMMVEDHPFEYKDFEGIIPPGNYGAGTVMIWDSGTYLLKDRSDNLDMPEKIKKGDFSFSLFGKKTRGEFSLVRLKNAKENSWLLICKKSDVNQEFDEDISVKSGLTLEEISSQQFDLKKAKKDVMPEFVSPMLATLIEKPFNDAKWIFEIKWDGYRMIARKNGDEIQLYSRNKKSFNEIFCSIKTTLQEIKGDFILDGEVVAVDENGNSTFQLLQNYMTKKKGTLIYYVFDILYLNGYDLMNLTLIERRRLLENILMNKKNIKISETISEKGIELFENISKHGGEGIIGKKIDSIYKEGARSPEWVKIKSIQSQDAIICGFTEPRGGRKKFGALVLGVHENDEIVYIGHVGGGFDDDRLSSMMTKFENLISDKSPFKKLPKTNMPVKWLNPILVCDIKFSNWTEEGIMRQPIFEGIRLDKNPKDVHRELPIKKTATNKDVKKNYSSEKEGHEEVVFGKKIVLTNLEKVYWPEEGYTKGDLVEYYKKISKYILPYLKNRPQSLNRYPNGIQGKNFFQKDFNDVPGWIKTIKISSDSEEKEINYLLCQDKASLLYIANLGCIEINVWNSSVKNLSNPDYMVLDIDPLDLPFSFAVVVALETKKILDEISLEAFCKTSGSRGLHIFVPLGAKYAYQQVKEFAKLINIMVNLSLPKITSIERNPNLRNQKVYLDYLQNRKGQTMASAYCIRPKAGAPISTPLEWDELNEKLDPKKFNMRTIFSRLKKKGDIWKNMLSSGKNADLKLSLMKLGKIINSRNKRKR